MQGSFTRVRAVINGHMPDRAPLFELLRNDAVIQHFTGRELTVANGPQVVYQAYEPAVDATRMSVKLPCDEKTSVSSDGREQRSYRWTAWRAPCQYPDSDAYARAKRQELQSANPSDWGTERSRGLLNKLAMIAEERRKLGEVFFMPTLAGPGLMEIYGEVGIEAFSYYIADCPDIIVALLERNTIMAITCAENHSQNNGIEAGFLGDDVAFKAGPLINPAWLKEHYFPRLARVVAAWHAKGIKVLFHSDGNLNPILGDLVETGIDGLNPIEVMAGMDVGAIHRRYPHLFLAGGIDVSQLLPFGTPQQVKDAVIRAIDAAEGRIMIGSSTELNNEVPLENYLALRAVVLEHAY